MSVPEQRQATPLITTTVAAEQADVTVATIYRWVAEGRLVAVACILSSHEHVFPLAAVLRAERSARMRLRQRTQHAEEKLARIFGA